MHLSAWAPILQSDPSGQIPMPTRSPDDFSGPLLGHTHPAMQIRLQVKGLVLYVLINVWQFERAAITKRPVKLKIYILKKALPFLCYQQLRLFQLIAFF